MKVPVFVSCPIALSPAQERSYEIITAEMDILQLEPRALGRGDYPAELPLREVFSIARHCAGGIILGFSQFETDSGTWKQGTDAERLQSSRIVFATPWNHLEAGILYGLGLPLLIFREETITGGIFDPGITDTFTHNMPSLPLDDEKRDTLRQVFLKWSAGVRANYHSANHIATFLIARLS